MDIVYFGSGHFGIPCLDAISHSRHRMLLAVTACPHPAGRGRKPAPTAVEQWAVSHGVDVLRTDQVNDEDVIETVRACRPDLLLVIAFGQKLGPELIRIPSKGAINVHASLLPRWRGAAPINWAIMAGDQRTGVSIITLSDQIDAGQIIAQQATDIAADEDAGQLHDRLALLAAPLLITTLDQIEDGTARYVPQDPGAVTYARRLKKPDGFIDFAKSAEQLARTIRGLWPWPGAIADYVSQDGGRCVRVTLARAVPVDAEAGFRPGVLDNRLCITCGDGALRIIAIRPAGSSLMDLRDFCNGRHIRPGDAFMSVNTC